VSDSLRRRRVCEAMYAVERFLYSRLFSLLLQNLGDATPSDADLTIARTFLMTLNQQTAKDHLRATDEMLMQVPCLTLVIAKHR
jgi:hypothetical protein